MNNFVLWTFFDNFDKTAKFVTFLQIFRLNIIVMEQKKYKNGLVLGKFMPLHNGHMLLISSAAKDCENLTVLVCSLKSEPIPGNLRYGWVKSFCSNSASKINVVNITEELPQLPEEHPQFWDIWCDLIKKNCPGIEAIFSSEDYGFELAKRLNIKHELVDKERIKQPVSGTAIRNNPFANWQYIYYKAKPYFMKRIYFLGPESTGKSTTSKLLADKFDVNWVPEYGRFLYEEKNGELEFMDFCEIVIKQRDIENKLTNNSQKPFILCDTDVITTKVFCELYYPEEFHKLDEFFDFHIKKQLENNCHFFIMYPDIIEAVQDGTRKFINYQARMKHYDMIVKELTKWDIPCTVLTGGHEHRIETIEEFIENSNFNIQPHIND